MEKCPNKNLSNTCWQKMRNIKKRFLINDSNNFYEEYYGKK